MAHIGQEVALGAVGAFRLFKRRRQLERARRDQVLEFVPMLREFVGQTQALGDVVLKAQHITRPAPFDARRTDLGVEGAAILALLYGLENAALGADGTNLDFQFCPRVFCLPVPDVQSHHVLERIAEHLGKLVVGFEHAAVVVEDDNAVTNIGEQGASPRSLGGALRLGLAPGFFLGTEAIDQLVEMLGQTANFICGLLWTNARRAVPVAQGGHRPGNLPEAPGQMLGATLKEQREHQHGQRQERRNTAQQQPFFAHIRRLREACIDHADTLAFAVFDRLVARYLPAIDDQGPPGPGFTLPEYLRCYVGSGPHTGGAVAISKQDIGGNAQVIHENAGRSDDTGGLGTHRIDDGANVVDQRRIPVEQNAAEQNGVGVLVREREVNGKIHEQAACFHGASASGCRHQIDARARRKCRRNHGQLTGAQAFVSETWHAGTGLAGDKGAGQDLPGADFST